MELQMSSAALSSTDHGREGFKMPLNTLEVISGTYLLSQSLEWGKNWT